MSSFSRLIVVMIWVLNVEARNATLVHGWIPEPEGRGTWSIVWSCLATVFICTWSALHLDVPTRHGRWYLFFRKVGYMLGAVMAPELILGEAASGFYVARFFWKRLNKQGDKRWTRTHIRFARANGFSTDTPSDGVSIYRLIELIKEGAIDGPPISEDELASRGKTDGVIKLIAVLQITWFAMQTLIRLVRHYHVTILEVMTVAYVLCTVFIYIFYLNKPQDVQYPVILKTRTTTLAIDENASMGNSPESNQAREEAERAPPTPQVRTLRRDLPSAIDESFFVISGLFACGFGAIHCLAWNSPFPTAKERLAWRVCSVAMTALPLPIILLLYMGDTSNTWGWPFNDRLQSYLDVVFIPLVVFYAIARTTLIVLAFMALRAMPADAFQTVHWMSYVPHVFT